MTPDQQTDLISRDDRHHSLCADTVLRGDIVDDANAIDVFLKSYAMHSPETQKAYRKECRRFLCWLHDTSQPALSMLPNVTVEDINSYLQFLASPTKRIGDETLVRFGMTHQPFKNCPLSTSSIRLAIAVLNSLFESLRNLRTTGNQPYCRFNPMKLALKRAPGNASAKTVLERALSETEWDAIQKAIEQLPKATIDDLKHYHRVRWVFNLLLRSFLRRSEAVSLRMADFVAGKNGYLINVVGKGNKAASIVVTSKLLDELKIYRRSLGLPELPLFGEDAPAIQSVRKTGGCITSQTLNLICKVLFQRASEILKQNGNMAAAVRLQEASAHWMRHTGVTFAMEAGIDPRYVQQQARHSSLNTTSRYDHKNQQKMTQQMEKMK